MSRGERFIDAIESLVRIYRRWHWIAASAFLLLALALLATWLVQGSSRSALLGAACLAWAVACADPRLFQSPREPAQQLATTTRAAFAVAMLLGLVLALQVLTTTG